MCHFLSCLTNEPRGMQAVSGILSMFSPSSIKSTQPILLIFAIKVHSYNLTHTICILAKMKRKFKILTVMQYLCTLYAHTAGHNSWMYGNLQPVSVKWNFFLCVLPLQITFTDLTKHSNLYFLHLTISEG